MAWDKVWGFRVHCRKVVRDRMTRDDGGWAGVKMRVERGDK